jgi:hypothetical protein
MDIYISFHPRYRCESSHRRYLSKRTNPATLSSLFLRSEYEFRITIPLFHIVNHLTTQNYTSIISYFTHYRQPIQPRSIHVLITTRHTLATLTIIPDPPPRSAKLSRLIATWEEEGAVQCSAVHSVFPALLLAVLIHWLRMGHKCA